MDGGRRFTAPEFPLGSPEFSGSDQDRGNFLLRRRIIHFPELDPEADSLPGRLHRLRIVGRGAPSAESISETLAECLTPIRDSGRGRTDAAERGLAEAKQLVGKRAITRATEDFPALGSTASLLPGEHSLTCRPGPGSSLDDSIEVGSTSAFDASAGAAVEE